MARDSRRSLHFSPIRAAHAYRFDVLVRNVTHVAFHLCRILSSLYSGSVCIWDYQAQARVRAGFHVLFSYLICVQFKSHEQNAMSSSLCSSY
jgi:hypothetical protein